MGQDVKGRSDLCPLPPGPLKEIPRHMKPRTIMAVGLTFMLTTTGLVYYLILPIPWRIITDPVPKVYTPHGVIAIDGDTNFSATALLEGWPGDGSPEDPFIIDGLKIDLGGGVGHCIRIDNTNVSFTIRNCNLTGASGEHPLGGWHAAGIFLIDVTNGELVNNICSSNNNGILLFHSGDSTVVNNTCNNNDLGISLIFSDSNTVINNTCNSNGVGINLDNYWEASAYNTVMNNTCCNGQYGISIVHSDSNTVVNNTCFNNTESGISLENSHFNTVANNTCTSNDNGIYLYESDYNTLANNTCNNNRIGIYLDLSRGNTVVNNTCSGSTESGIYLEDSDENTMANNIFGISKEFATVALLIGLAGIIMLGAAWRMLSGMRKFD